MVKRAGPMPLFRYLLQSFSWLCLLFISGTSAAAPVAASKPAGTSRGWVEVKDVKKAQPKVSGNYNEVRDAQGRRYAMNNHHQYSVVLWNGKQWDKVLRDEGHWHPELLAPVGQGVLCVWNRSTTTSDGESTEHYRLSLLQGRTSRWLRHDAMQAKFLDGSLYSPQFLKTGSAQLLLINNRDFYHITPQGGVSRVFTATPDKLHRLGPLNQHRERFNGLRFLDDNRGGYWFWSNVWEHGEGAYSLRGLLRWDGRKLTQLSTLDGLSLTKTAVDALEWRDAKRLWLALGERGLYELDSTTRRIPEPAPRAFRYVQQIKLLGRDVFVVAFSEDHDPESDVMQRAGQLWRLRDGQWSRLIDGLDLWAGDDTKRPIASAPSGVWTASTEGGVWLAPPRGAPVLIDWRRGLPMHSIRDITTQKDGSVLLTGDGTLGTMRIVNVAALLAQRPTTRVSVFMPYITLAQDRRGALWAIHSLRAKALGQWNGARWVHHPVPRGYKLSNAGELAFDRLHRVWILSDYRDGQVAVFNPSQRGPAAWRVFTDYRAALRAQIGIQAKAPASVRAASPTKVRAIVPRPTQQKIQHDKTPPLPLFHRETSDGQQLPRQTPDYLNRRLCYRSVRDILHYFDGKAWHRWSNAQIAPKASMDARSSNGAPYFNRAGVLCVPLKGGTWQKTATGWSMAKEEVPDPRPAAGPQSTWIDAPEKLFQDLERGYAKAARDRAGYYYVTFKGQLYRTTPDNVTPRLRAPLFEAHENHPFMSGILFERAFFDGAGNVFFVMATDEVVLLPARTEADTKATARALSVDAYEITGAAPGATGKHWFTWRLDGGKWSTPQETSKIQLTELPGGAHRLEVATIDRYLRRDPTPAVLSFTVNLDAEKQVAAFIANLSSPDFTQREKAIQLLTKQPGRALPALKAARANADGDLKWWIDAAIQAIEASR